MKITGLRCVQVEIPLEKPIRTAIHDVRTVGCERVVDHRRRLEVVLGGRSRQSEIAESTRKGVHGRTVGGRDRETGGGPEGE